MKNFLKQMVERYIKHDVSQSAGQIAYFGFLSLFPFIVYMNFIIHKLHLTTGDIISVLSPIFPEEIINFITAYIDYISSQNSYGVLSIGIVSTVYLISRVIRSMEQSAQKAYGINSRRTFFGGLLVSFIVIVCIALMLVSAAMFVILSRRPVRFLLDIFGLSNMVGAILVLKWAFVIFIMLIVFSLIYRLIPNKKITFASVVPGTIFALAGFLILSSGLGVYVNFAAASSSIYGYIGTVFITLIWIYFIGVIFVLGAEINGYFDAKKENEKNT